MIVSNFFHGQYSRTYVRCRTFVRSLSCCIFFLSLFLSRQLIAANVVLFLARLVVLPFVSNKTLFPPILMYPALIGSLFRTILTIFKKQFVISLLYLKVERTHTFLPFTQVRCCQSCILIHCSQTWSKIKWDRLHENSFELGRKQNNEQQGNLLYIHGICSAGRNVNETKAAGLQFYLIGWVICTPH